MFVQNEAGSRPAAPRVPIYQARFGLERTQVHGGNLAVAATFRLIRNLLPLAQCLQTGPFDG